MESVREFLQYAYFNVSQNLMGLAIPCLFFFTISVWLNRDRLEQVARRVIPETRFNFAIYLIDIILILPLMALLIVAIKSSVQFLNIALVSEAAWNSLNAAFVIFAAVFLGDFIGYWRHRFEHTRWIWPAHVMHHSDTEMTWFSLHRFHPFNRFTTTLIDTTFLAIWGFPDWALLANVMTRHYYGFFIHANIPWSYGPLSYIFVSPTMHRWHHVREVQGSGSNFATVFSVFDRSFGTYYVPGTCDVALGVTPQPKPGIIPNLVYPARIWFNRLKRMSSS